MANRRVRLFVLSKSSAMERVANRRKITVDELLNDGIPEAGRFYLYVRIKSLDSSVVDDSSGQRRLRCFFDELDFETDVATGRRGRLSLSGRSLIDIAHCISLPANFFLCDFQMDSDQAAGVGRINLFDIELEMDDERSENGEIYKIEAEAQRRPTLPLDSEYTELKSVVEAQKICVFGVIKKIVVLENGNLKLYLTDPSLDFDNHIICFMASRFNNLPVQAKEGDVLRLHRISARFQHGVMQLFGCMEKFGLSWLLFDGTPGSDLTPVPSSHNFTLSDKDKDRARCYRSWYLNASKRQPRERFDRPPAVDSVIELKHFRLKSYGNLLLQVVGVFESVRSSKPIIIRGWDGTKCSLPSMKVDPEQEQMPVLSFDNDLWEAVSDWGIDVFVYDQHRDKARYLTADQYILLTNVHFGFSKPPDYAFSLHGGPRSEVYGRDVVELDATDPRVTDVKSRMDSVIAKLPREQSSKLRESRLVKEGVFTDKSQPPTDDQRRAHSVPPEFRERIVPGRPDTSSPLRNTNVNEAPQGRTEPATTPSLLKRPRKPRTSSATAVNAGRLLRSRETSSPALSVSSIVDFDHLRRPPLIHSSQHQVTATTSSPRRSPVKNITSGDSSSGDSDSSDDAIYSQQSPKQNQRTRSAPRPPMVSISVGTSPRIERPSVRRGNARKVATSTTPTTKTATDRVERPRRSTTVKTTFFEEDISDISSDDDESESESEDEEEGQRRKLHLRNRTVDVQVTQQRSPSSGKGGSPQRKNPVRGVQKAKRGRRK